MAQRNNGTLALFIGISRSGKSVPLKVAALLHKRVLAFDPKEEMVSQLGYERFDNAHEFLEAVIAAGDGDCKLCLVSSDKKDFNFFCDVAFNFNRQRECAIVCEELAAVTNNGKAAGHWGRLVNQGLAYGMTLFATVQRGQEVDKSIMNNATFLHVTQHSTDGDRMYIAGKLGLDVDVIPGEPLEYIQWTGRKKLVAKGKVDFSGKAGQFWAKGSPVFKNQGKVTKILSDGKLSKVVY